MQKKNIFKKLITVGMLSVSLLSSVSNANTTQNKSDSPTPKQLYTPLSLTQQAKKAEIILRLQIENPILSKEKTAHYLVYPIKIVETIVGKSSDLPQYKGKPALFFLNGLKDLPNLTQNQEVIALLYKDKLDSPIVGFNQGIYTIKNQKVINSKFKSADDLRNAIRKARQGEKK